MLNVIKDYLISIGMHVDKKSFQEADNAVKKVDSKLNKISKSSGKSLATVAKAGTALIATVGIALGKMASSVAEADRQMGLLAHRLYTTKENARSLTMAMKAMHVASMEELRELALDPESRRQFMELKDLAKSLENGNYQAKLKEIRELNHEFRKMMVKFEYLKIEFASWLAGFMKDIHSVTNTLKPLIKWIVNMVRGVTILAVNGWKMIFEGIKNLPHSLKGAFNVLRVVLAPIVKIFKFIEDLVVYLAGGKSHLEPIFDMIPFLRNTRQAVTGEVTPQQEFIANAEENLKVARGVKKNIKNRDREQRNYKWGESVGGFRANRIDANGQRSAKDLVLSTGNVLYLNELGQALGDVAGKFRITSGWEEGHSKNSKHHYGRAMDFGFGGTSLSDQVALIKAVLASKNTAQAFLEVDAKTYNQIRNQLAQEGVDMGSKVKFLESNKGNHLHVEDKPYLDQVENRAFNQMQQTNVINVMSTDPKEGAQEVTRNINLLYNGRIKP